MPINFVTGLPRHGKTLWTICHVKERAEKEKRQVYTCNIPGVTIDGWLTIDHPDKWMDLPDDAIVIVDELQDFWGRNAVGSKVPMPILELSKHGKRAFDFYFITQEPDLVHATPRGLCELHYYIVRAFGTHNATVRKFQRMQLHPDKQKKLGELTPWRYPKEAFGWYKSADVHNIKRKIPLKILMIPALLVLVGLLLFGAWKFFGATILQAQAGGQKKLAQSAVVSPPAGSSGAKGSSTEGHLSPADYAQSFQPRIEGLAYTAPRYDDITKPIYAPYPAACLAMGSRCECYTQQATKLPVPLALCAAIVKGGFFNDWQQALIDASRGQHVRSDPLPLPVSSAAPYMPSIPVPVVVAEAVADPKLPARRVTR